MSEKQHDEKAKAEHELLTGPVWLRPGGQHVQDLRDIPDMFTLPDGVVVTTEGIKFDSGKLRMDLVPTEAINALAAILAAGAVKYGEHNWRKGMDWSRVYGAAQRHLLAFWGGDDIDEESGMPHLWHALTNLAFLVSYQAMSVGRDDRWKQEGDE